MPVDFYVDITDLSIYLLGTFQVENLVLNFTTTTIEIDILWPKLKVRTWLVVIPEPSYNRLTGYVFRILWPKMDLYNFG